MRKTRQRHSTVFTALFWSLFSHCRADFSPLRCAARLSLLGVGLGWCNALFYDDMICHDMSHSVSRQTYKNAAFMAATPYCICSTRVSLIDGSWSMSYSFFFQRWMHVSDLSRSTDQFLRHYLDYIILESFCECLSVASHVARKHKSNTTTVVIEMILQGGWCLHARHLCAWGSLGVCLGFILVGVLWSKEFGVRGSPSIPRGVSR